jgi:hypothetical protein
MSIHKTGINDPMSVATFDDDAAREWVVDQVKARRPAHKDKPSTRIALADEIGLAPGTIENIERERHKGLRGWMRDKIQAHKIQWLEAEIARLHDELEKTRRGGSRASPKQIHKARSLLDEMAALLERERG